jgi:hypothetical protein
MRICVPEIPDYLPQAAGAYPAKQSRRTGFEQDCQVPGKLRKILNAIERPEVGERTVEDVTVSQGGDVFGRQQVGFYQVAFIASSNSPAGDFDHLLRIVAGDDFHSAVGQEAGVDASSTAKLQNSITRVECRLKFFPHRCSLGTPDLRVRERFVVALGERVERGRIKLP